MRGDGTRQGVVGGGLRSVLAMPSGFGPLAGQPAFEVARGVVMALCACDAEQARGRMSEITGGTGGPPEDLVAALLTSAGRAELRPLLQPRDSW